MEVEAVVIIFWGTCGTHLEGLRKSWISIWIL